MIIIIEARTAVNYAAPYEGVPCVARESEFYKMKNDTHQLSVYASATEREEDAVHPAR